MYNVVFVYTREAGGLEGVVTRTSYQSKEDFDKSYAEWDDEVKRKQRVLAEGVSDERAHELVESTPRACRIAAAVEASRDENGKIHPFILEHELIKALVV